MNQEQDTISNYQKEYSDFIKNYKEGAVSSESIGLVVVRMTNYFIEINNRTAIANINFTRRFANIMESSDASTLKPISAAKAEILAKASEEANIFETYRAHLTNLEQIINSLKALQKGILQEYLHVGNT